MLCSAVIVAGCGGQEDDGFANRLSPASGANGGPKTMRYGNGSEPGSLDPHKASGVPASNVLHDLYEGLVITGDHAQIVPGVAKSWEISDDRLTYTFHLRDDAKWSNGAPVTAQDFVYSLRRSVDPKVASPYADIHSPIVNAEPIIAGKKDPDTLGVKALDPHTLQIRLKEPTPFFLKTLAHTSSDPVYKPAVKKWGDSFTQPGHAVTNGAYEMKTWRVNERITLKRNPYYWDNAHTRIDQVEYFPIDDPKSELSRYQAGGLDWTYTMPPSEIGRIKKTIPGQYHAVPTLGIAYLGLNVRRAPFKNSPKLRMALSMALNRRVITEKILRGGEAPAYSLIPPAMNDYDPVEYQWKNWSDAKREAMARKLYHEAGYSDAHPLKAEYLYPSGGQGKVIGIVAAAMWRKVLGADITPVNQEWKVFLQTTREGYETQIFWGGWIGDYEDPNTFLSIFNSKAALDYPGYDSAVYDAAQEASSHTPNGPKRTALLHKAEGTLLHDAPIIPVWFWTNHHLVKPYVKGFTGNALDNYYTKNFDIVPAGSSDRRAASDNKGASHAP
ncbi:peptide ABC transporter substrate-binding protein [Salinisphaera sp. Q1T1-3]|nr:peptide ABC transporter substrate-binding protein [Salinisphaera sp. Q1T1-3]